MKQFVALSMIVASSLPLVGCDKKNSEVKVKTTVTEPDGSKTTTTDTHKVETTGEKLPASR
jgi:hypothetical protein